MMRMRKVAGALGAIGIAGGVVLGAAMVAGATPVGLQCIAVVGPPLNLTVHVDGDPTTPGTQPQITDFVVTAPAEVEEGDLLTITLPGGSTTLPDESTGLQVDRYENVATSYKVIGATIVPGSVSASGPPIINGSPGTPGAPVVTSDTLTIGTPGPIVPTFVPGDGGGATLESPTITFQVTTGAVGTVIKVIPNGTTLTAFPIIGTPTAATTTCTPPPNGLVGGDPVVLSSTLVVAPPPPPPGAPDAVTDNVSTPKNTSVLIDVVANDTKNPQFDIDPTSLAVTTAPTKGTAVIEDGKIRYTPNEGVVGTDSFRYQLCSVGDGETSGPCDTASVNVTITDPDVAPATTTTVAQSGATTPTTAAAVAAAGPAQLPRTGGTAAPLAGVGASLLLGGLALVMRNRRPRGRFAQ